MGTGAPCSPQARRGRPQAPVFARAHAAPAPSRIAWCAPTFAPRFAPTFAPTFAPWFGHRSQCRTTPVAITPAYRSYERSQLDTTCSRGMVGSGLVLLRWIEGGGAAPGGVSMNRALVR